MDTPQLCKHGSAVLAALLIAATGHAADATTGARLAQADDTSQSATTEKVTQQTLRDRIDKKDSNLVVVDVRTPEEYAEGHVPGAINIPYTHLPASITSIPSPAEKDIVLYCEVGVRAERAASRLRENGFTRVLHLDGDMKQWRENKQPLQK